MQSWPLERKIQVTQTRIIEWYEKWEGKVCVSFSGGKDSTVLLDLVRRIYPDVKATFVDTGLEYPELREFVRTIDNVDWLKPEMNFRKVIEEYGYPIISKEVSLYIYYARKAKERGDIDQYEYYVNGKRKGKNGETYIFAPMSKTALKLLNSDIQVGSKCCSIMKERPLQKYHKQNEVYPFIATMATESVRRRNGWLKNGCNAFESKNPRSIPMAFWTEQDVLEYLKRFNISYSSVYGDIVQDENGKYHTTGCNRTGCLYCAYGSHLEKEPNRFQRLKQTHPKLWNYCMKPWDEGGLGMKPVLEFIGVKTE